MLYIVLNNFYIFGKTSTRIRVTNCLGKIISETFVTFCSNF